VIAMTRILIVDDKEENVYYLQALLTGHGFGVDSARHGAEALVKARQAPPDMLISDLLMPVMDGYTLLRLWKADARLKQIPFVVYTATYTEPQDERLALSLGADAFILKPLEPEVFLARLREILAIAAAAGPVLQRIAEQRAELSAMIGAGVPASVQQMMLGGLARMKSNLLNNADGPGMGADAVKEIA